MCWDREKTVSEAGDGLQKRPLRRLSRVTDAALTLMSTSTQYQGVLVQ